MADDGYVAWHQAKLWKLLPAIYRTLDQAPKAGPLLEIVDRIGGEFATLRRGVDRLWANQSIETCDDWVIPYIGDLLATRLVSCLDARAQRVDVAKTIYYRRRSGTLGLLEELAADIAGRDARAVEFFRRLGRTRHQFDPQIGNVFATGASAWTPNTIYAPGTIVANGLNAYVCVAGGTSAPSGGPTGAGNAIIDGGVTWNFQETLGALVPAVIQGLAGSNSRTPAGGFADLRNAFAAESSVGAFDEYAHTADLRRGVQSAGWHNIPHLGVFIWWLYAYPIRAATPVSNGADPPCFSFDPSGRTIPLFAQSSRSGANKASSFGEDWIEPDAWALPVPVSETLWITYPDQLYPNSFAVDFGGGTTPAPLPRTDVRIHPERGVLSYVGAPPLGAPVVSYHSGFSSPIGAGGFDERVLETIDQPATVATVNGGGGLDAALAAVTGSGTVEIADTLTYPGLAAPFNLPAPPAPSTPGVVQVRARNEERPLIRWAGGGASWTIVGAGGSLILQGLWLQGADVVLTGAFETVQLRLMTLDPGTEGLGGALFDTAIDAMPLAPTTLWIEGTVQNLVLERCVTGPIRTRNGGAVEQLTATDSIIQAIATHALTPAAPIFDPVALAEAWKAALADEGKSGVDPVSEALVAAMPQATKDALNAYVLGTAPDATLVADMAALLAGQDREAMEGAYPLALADLALGGSSGEASLARCTVLGRSAVHRLSASECILDDITTVEDTQQGCVRFSAYANGSIVHAPYRSVTVSPRGPLFRTRRFGDPNYARLYRLADAAIINPQTGDSILGGAQNESEMGAFKLEDISLIKRGLALKYEEYAPLGIYPVWIDAD
jgi:hypothetical protein